MSVVITAFRTCAVGPSADRQGRCGGRLIDRVACCRDAGSFVLDTNLRLAETADLPDGNGTAARALFVRLMQHGNAIIIQGRSHCTQDKESDSPSA
jgi:hypothetical protein